MAPDDSTPIVPPNDLFALAFRVPEGSTPYDLVITPREAILFLSLSAVEYWNNPCLDTRCEVCHEFAACWKSLYNSLDAADRAAVEESLERNDSRAPTFPPVFQ